MYSMATGPSGRRGIVVSPETTYSVEAGADGYVSQSREVLSPAEGGERLVVFELEPEDPRPSLRVTLVPPVKKAGFAFFREGEDSTAIDVDAEARDGTFRIGGLLPGRFRLVARPGGGWKETRGYWLDAETMVTLPERGETAVTLPIRPGGRLRISLTGPDDEPIRAPCTIRDQAGNPVPVTFRAHYGGGTMMSSRRRITGGGPNEVEPALPPGRYRVEIAREGYRPLSVAVEIRAGSTASLDLALEKE
jgi:hypothetical protein